MLPSRRSANPWNVATATGRARSTRASNKRRRNVFAADLENVTTMIDVGSVPSATSLST